MPTSPESGFRGFPADALDFYAGLAKDNTKAYWERRKPTYENSVRAPMEALLGSLPDGFPPFRIMRPYRDVRFTKDKSLYKTECGASGWTDGGAGFYLGLSADGFLVGGGIYQLGRDQLERFRAAVDDESSGSVLEQLVARAEAVRLDVGPGMEPPLKTAPRGYPREHPRLELLQWKGCVAMASTRNKRVIGSGQLASWVVDRLEASRPLMEWLGEHVGPTAEDRPGPRAR